MSLLKKRISMVLAVIMIGIALIPVLSMVNAADTVVENIMPKVTMKHNGTTISHSGSFRSAKNGDTFTFTASCLDSRAVEWSKNESFMKNAPNGPFTVNDEGMAILKYCIKKVSESKIVEENITADIQLDDPTSGSVKINGLEDGYYAIGLIAVGACDKLPVDGGIITATTGWKYYFFKIGSDTPDEPDEPTTIDVEVKYDGKVLKINSTTSAELGGKITLAGIPENKTKKLFYSWDDEKETEYTGSSTKITIPEDFESGKHKLLVLAQYTDGTYLGKWRVYYFNIEDGAVNEDEELIVEPWMKENSDLDSLAVSLRNDSDTTKANKNIYALDDEVIYYVDYKNGGSDIKSEVKLILNLPLAFEVVDAAGGKVSTSDKTITWTFPNGLEEDQAGTKEVTIKYTSLGKNSLTYKVINPIADIKKASKTIDSSSVINMIVKSNKTEIEETHYPYMYGDKDTPTFRPDDTITRAEAALVLTRIFGISTNYTSNDYNYPDLNETYAEARKAIVAATAYGLLKGYPDGTYRPNEEMTRAEFMTVIARRIEIENEDVRGFDIKEADTNIKVYKDTTYQYNVNGQTISEHWALDELTYLARLNMTGVTKSDKNLKPDDRITRAEVAQLVNFYLLRAPAKVSYSDSLQFIDVSSGHKLYADIVEAVRGSHTFKVTSDGRETAIY